MATDLTIHEATKRYEAWLARNTDVVEADLKQKHQLMAVSAFAFLRATFYRWAQLWPSVAKAAAGAPYLLAVGDLHVENFGTWRDAEGRLIWGINDLDEASEMPYTVDLVRLVTSAGLACRENHLAIGLEDSCRAVLEGYGHAMDTGGLPYVLEEQHEGLRMLALNASRAPAPFWKKIDALPELTDPIPAIPRALLEDAIPQRGMGGYRVVHRVAGLGSLGRQRFTAVATWQGGRIARDIKPLLPSAWSWAQASGGGDEIKYESLLRNSIRCADPFVSVRDGWVVRRIGPDCSRIELSSLPKEHDEYRLLRAMGFETGNLHLGSAAVVQQVRNDLRHRPPGWLMTSANHMLKALLDDWTEWKKRG